ncbi:MAG: hypothetical protein KDD82_12800 [Planctomycetes bacterium]|nr:hypothetical protein [Planctomycetota bacterium]
MLVRRVRPIPALCALAAALCAAPPGLLPDAAGAPPGVKGNGAPNGAHYTLNLIGVPKSKSAAMDDNNGRRIFVRLEGKSRILLSQGPDFQVLDANATDGSGAFQLPNPDPDNDGVTEYSVFARALGKPGGGASLTPAAVDPVTGDVYYSVETAVFVREKGGSKFTNVSRELLYVQVDLDGDGVLERLPLFDERLQDYFWDYDNGGLKLVQLRFYPVATDTNQ